MNRIVKIAFRERPESVFCTEEMTADAARAFLERISRAMQAKSGIAIYDHGTVIWADSVICAWVE